MLQKTDLPNSQEKGSKTQKRFHELLKTIQLLKTRIEEKKAFVSKASLFRNEQLIPLINQLRAVKLSQVRALDWAYDRHSFAKRLKLLLREEILARVNEILQNYSLDTEQEAEVTAILAHHSGNDAEELYENLQEIKDQETRAYIRFHYGIDLDENESADLHDPEVIEKIRAKIAEKNSNQKQQYTNTETDDRQKNKKNQLQEKLNKSIRSVYTSLIKLLHPDKVMDEEKKLLYTEAIKEVTQAYEANDMLALLILQSKHGIMEETIDESELRTYNKILQKQVDALKMEYDQIAHTTQGIPMSSAATMEKFLNSEKNSLKKQLKHEQRLLHEVFEEEDMLMQYLKHGAY